MLIEPLPWQTSPRDDEQQRELEMQTFAQAQTRVKKRG